MYGLVTITHDLRVSLESEKKDTFTAEIGEFVSTVKNGTEMPVTLAQSRQVLEIIITKEVLARGRQS